MEAAQAVQTKQYTADDFIPSSLWGKDHWSTLAYVETVATDCAGFQVGNDPRMRSNRRNFRVMQDCMKPRRPQSQRAVGVYSSHGTRLNDGQVIEQHDDWSCLQDMANEGLFNLTASGVQPGVTLRLSAKGQAWCAAVRAHKQAGGNFHDVDVTKMPEVESAAPHDVEFFDFMGMSFNVTDVLADLEAKSIRPNKSQFDKAFIEQFATQVHGLKKNDPQSQTISVMSGVRAADVHQIPDSAFDKPLILAYAGKNKGILNIDGSGANYLLIDGNKRLGKAFFTDRDSVEVVVLSQAQSRKYKM